jgi:hypothetical protein
LQWREVHQGGDSWTPEIAAVRCWVAAMIQSVGVMMGTAMAWCLKQNVSVRRLPPVPFIMVWMQW